VLNGSIITGTVTVPWKAAGKLEKDRFYNLRLVYDLAQLRVFLDGKPVAAVPVSGVFVDGWILCVGGAPEKTPPKVSNVLQKTEESSSIPNSGFRFSGKLRSLRISNCPDLN
jgi:hypothetical protein